SRSRPLPAAAASTDGRRSGPGTEAMAVAAPRVRREPLRPRGGGSPRPAGPGAWVLTPAPGYRGRCGRAVGRGAGARATLPIMLVAAAVCPCPPLLVPEVAAGAAPELDAARAACADALGVFAAARPDLLVVVGPADGPGVASYPQGTAGSFRGFGVDLGVRLGASPDGTGDAADAEAGGGLPPALAVGAWLLDRAGWTHAPVEGLGVPEPLAAERCIQEGKDLAARAERVALLMMGDASAGRTLKAPGYLDE